MLHTCLSLESSYIPVADRRRTLKRDSYRCVWCGKLEEHDVSHFIQRRCGGKTFEDNLVTTCKECKRKRHYDSPTEFISKLKLEQLDFPREVKSMRIKVVFHTGEEVEGIVENVPPLGTKAFYIRKEGNGQRRQIYTEPGMQIIELGGEE